MNLAAILPRLPHLAFRLPLRRPTVRTAAAAPVAPRRMARHATMTLENRPLRLSVLRGWVWITRDGCPADILLGAGDVFEQRPGARVLVQALEEAQLLIAGAGPGAQNGQP